MKTKFLSLFVVVSVLFMASCKKEDVEVILEALYNANHVTAYDCWQLDSLNSLSGTPALNFKIENRASSDIKIQWIHFNGELVTYQEALQPGDNYLVQSFQWHYWYISDSEGDCIGIFTPLSLLTTNVITVQDQ